MSDENKNHHPGTGSTGPRTPAGKERSSRNAVTHGARSSKHAILPGESEAEYEKIRRGWLAEFRPTTPLEAEMVDRLIQRHWSMKRCDRLCEEAEQKLFLNNPDLTSWSEEDHRNLQRFQRYRTAAHRAYKAVWDEVELLRANRMKEPLLEQRLRCEIHHNLAIGALTPDDLENNDNEDAIPQADASDVDDGRPKWPDRTS